MIAKMFGILVWFVLVPFFTGMAVTGMCKEEKNSMLYTMLCGYLGMFALFEVLALPLIFAKASFSWLKIGYGTVSLGVALLSAWRERKRIGALTLGNLRQVKKLPFTCVAAGVLVALQIGIYVVGMSTDLDDALYVGTALTTLDTDTMFQYSAYTGNALKALPDRYVLSPFPILLAFYSSMIDMHPAVIAHTVQPVFFVALAYSVYALLGQKLFQKEQRSTGVFLSMVSLVHMFSYYSVYTQGTFLLIRIWQGKAVLAGVLLPAVFYFGMRVFEEKPAVGDWLGLLALMSACCLVSSMGILLAPVMLGIFGILHGLLKKRWRTLGGAVCCCIPCILCAGIYLMM